MTTPQLSLTVRLNTSAADSRRGVVRLHPEALAALGLREWDAIALVGARRTAVVAGLAPAGTPTGTILLDDVVLSNTGLKEDATVVVAPVTVYGARTVTVTGSTLARQSIPETTLRQALLGKVLTVGDAVSLLPRDLGPGTSNAETTRALSRTFAIAWTTELLTVSSVDPAGPVSVQPNTAVVWGGGPGTLPSSVPSASGFVSSGFVASSPATDRPESAPATPPPPPVEDLVGVQVQVAKLSEWLTLSLDEPELLRTLGASPHLGVLVTGPAGVGKATFVRSVVADRRLVEVDGPGVGALAADERLRRISAAAEAVRGGGVLLLTDVDAVLPADTEPVATLILDELRRVVDTEGRVERFRRRYGMDAEGGENR